MGCLSFFLFSAALFGSQPYWSLFMQNTWGYTPLQGGLAFLPATGLIVLFTPLTGLLAQWAGPRLNALLVIALLAMGLSFLYIVVTLTPQSDYVSGLLPTFINLSSGAGIGFMAGVCYTNGARPCCLHWRKANRADDHDVYTRQPG
jgi:hypothetical protein